MSLYQTLSPLPMNVDVVLPNQEQHLSLQSLALTVFTDLLQTPPYTVESSIQIDSALKRMMQAGVRLLFVTDAANQLTGLITSYDIMGEKPMIYLQQHDAQFHGINRSNILVEDIMQPLKEWRVLDFSLVERATIGDVIETFKKVNQRHLVVVERSAPSMIRGLFSATRIERELGKKFTNGEGVTLDTFAEIEHLLAH